MRHKSVVLILFFGLIMIYAQATVWRVNNNAAISANFTSFTAAQNAAAPNDTLYFEGSSVSYGNIVLTKPLTIIGPGYFLSENPQTQANKISSQFGTITFNSGSSASSIIGLYANTIILNVGNIEIIRNQIKGGIEIKSSIPFGNILINGNYITDGISGNGNAIITSSGTQLISNIIISNNYITAFNSAISFGSNCSGILSNNVVSKDVNISNFVFSNNIQKSNNVQINNNVFFNNIGSGTQFPAGNGNQQNINMTDVFVGTTSNSTDGQYQLKPGSPAIGAGNDGTDCGIFGGITPYVLSGLPAIPAIYEINMPSAGTSTNGINVTVKAKTH